MFDSGYFRLGRFGGAPIRIHWSAPIGAFLFCGMGFYPGAWVAFLLLILAHEIGHAVMVRLFRMHVVSVDVHGLGGLCQFVGSTSQMGRSLIAWGGVLGQLVMLAIAGLLWLVLPRFHNIYFWEGMGMFFRPNLMLMALNLLPAPGFDGQEAWKLFGSEGLPAWWRRRKSQKARVESKGGVVRPMPQKKQRFVSNRIEDEILEKTPTSTKRPPPHMLN
ncbi:MAG: hypothetical protein U0441_06135 [Polyangiaceae bacterium]